MCIPQRITVIKESFRQHQGCSKVRHIITDSRKTEAEPDTMRNKTPCLTYRKALAPRLLNLISNSHSEQKSSQKSVFKFVKIYSSIV